jgi:hypothetical protein
VGINTQAIPSGPAAPGRLKGVACIDKFGHGLLGKLTLLSLTSFGSGGRESRFNYTISENYLCRCLERGAFERITGVTSRRIAGESVPAGE